MTFWIFLLICDHDIISLTRFPLSLHRLCAQLIVPSSFLIPKSQADGCWVEQYWIFHLPTGWRFSEPYQLQACCEEGSPPWNSSRSLATLHAWEMCLHPQSFWTSNNQGWFWFLTRALFKGMWSAQLSRTLCWKGPCVWFTTLLALSWHYK